MLVALVQGKCQFFKVLKVKKAETSVFQVYLNTFEMPLKSKPSFNQLSKTEDCVTSLRKQADSLLGLFSQSWNESFLFVLSKMLISKMP